MSTKLFKQEGKKEGKMNVEATGVFHFAVSKWSAFMPLNDKLNRFEMHF